MKDKDDALDAMQDMIVILYENISKLKKEDSFYSWSKTILVNSCKNKLKKTKKLIFLEDIKDQAVGEVNDNPDDKIVLEKYLSQLSGKQQEVLRLRYYLDLDYQAISEMLKVPLGTVKSRLSSGMKQLKESLGGEYYNDKYR